MLELKPCPFCGGGAFYDVIGNKSSHTFVGFDYKIRCAKCEAEIPKVFDITLGMNRCGELIIKNDERAQAAEMWNRREA
ncbi:MAG: Lar family restriction alleviation protein [Eubacteriales bacterium]|nr:Lar family restriction alleviation protein [Eubacteriales bacterium]